jgi:uncharacterized DUF497 family protein
LRYTKTSFTWDAAKARKTPRVHGLSFDTAKEVFGDPNHATSEDYFIEDQSGRRYGVIGPTPNIVLREKGGQI